MTAGAGLPLSMAAFVFSQIASRRAYQSILGFEEPFGRPPLLRISSVVLGSAIGVCSICPFVSLIVPPALHFHCYSRTVGGVFDISLPCTIMHLLANRTRCSAVISPSRLMFFIAVFRMPC